jgi:enoyl-CoA hydratase
MNKNTVEPEKMQGVSFESGLHTGQAVAQNQSDTPKLGPRITMKNHYTYVDVSSDLGVATLTLNRPRAANAMNREMVEEINDALDEIEQDDSTRALVVTGVGAAFSAGFDLKQQAERRPRGVDVWREMLGLYSSTIMRFWHFEKPTIAAINGACMAGGFELALACDLSVASASAVFGEPELQFGAGIVAMLLPWFTSPKFAKRIILLGEDHMDAEEALRMGLVSRVVPNDRLLEYASQTASKLSRVDPSLIRQTKVAINRAYEEMGMYRSISQAVEIDVQVEASGTAEKHAFLDRLLKDGMQEAIRWRRSRFE